MITAVVAIAAIASAFGQEKVDTYEMSALEKSFDISVAEAKKGLDLYIKFNSSDDLWQSAGLVIESSKYLDFVNTVISAKAKYIEWSNVAEQNNVTELIKVMDKIKSPVLWGYWYSSEWNFDTHVKLTYKFMINDSFETPMLLILSGEYTSSSNQYINHDGGYFAFSSIEEIDAFLNAINHAEIKTKLSGQNDLFKN